MLKFFLAILGVQLVTAVLVLVIPFDPAQPATLVRPVAPILLIGLLSAFWFSSFAAHLTRKKISRLKEEFAGEREKIRVNAERAKARLLKRTYRQTARLERQRELRTNLKIGLAFGISLAAGALLLMGNFLTMGLLTLTTAVGALGGYLFRGSREAGKKAEFHPLPSTVGKGKTVAKKGGSPKEITSGNERS